MVVIDAFRAELNRYLTGETVRVQASFSDVVSVDTRRGVPIVVFDNGAVGRYESGSGTDTLVFSYTVGESDRSVESLKVLALAENDAVLTSASGEAVDVTIRRSGVQTNNEVLSLQTEMPVSVSSFSSALQTDQLPPKLLSVSADSGVYRQGDTLEFQLSFNEVVRVDVSQNAGLPTLSLSAGGEMLPVVASYAGGSGTKTLRFQYEVSANDPVANALNVASFNFNGGLVSDISGNLADVAIVAGQNALPSSVSIVIDGQNANMDMSPMSLASYSEDVVPAFIQSIAAVEGDGTYQAGDKLTFRIKLSEAVTVDASAGVPMLVLSNGAVAVYHSGSGSDELTFVYQVLASDRNADELRVLGVAENDATLLDAGGNATDVRVSQTNNLDVTNQVKISAQAPYIRTIDGVEGIYQPGDEIQLEVRFSEAVSVSDAPTLLLSNGARASYTSGTGTDTLMFSYTVGEGSAFSSADLDVSSLGLSTGGIVSVNSGNGVSTVVRPGILALSSDVVIDSTPPTGTVSIDAVALKKGESATVTLTFSEPVANPLSALEISNGTLDSLVTDETSEPGTVWKGTFRPDQDIESLTNTIVLDNSKVMDNPPADFGEGQSPSEWSFGNYGVGLSESEVFAIDTQSPVAQISSETLAGEGAVTNRLITVDFGEPVTGLTSSAITVSGSRKVPGTFTEVASGVYQLVVAPVEGAGTDTDKLSFGVSLLANAVTDAAGNSNVQLPATTFTWDEAAPEIASIASTSGSYVTGDVVAFAVTFDEVVSVSTPTDGAVPSLALSNGALAHYVSVSPDNPKTLRFEYVVASGDEATDLSVLALFENDGSIADASGNAAKVSIGSGNGLPGSTSILIDGVVPTITTMRSDDGLYLPGDEIAIEVQFSEAVHVDESEGSPVLALSNGALATYVGGSKTDVLHFKYVVVEGDYDAQDLDVLAFAEEGALVREYFGETDGQLELGDNANVAIRGEINSLAYRSEINIDSALPKIAQISANAGAYNAGDAIEIALSWSKGVSIDTTQGEPSLLLSNGALASYVPSLSSSTKLLFRYTVSENDAESGDLGIEAFRHGNARFEGLIAGGEAVLALPEQSLSAEGLLTIDLTPPEVVRFELSDTALSSGESATVTIELSEAVQQLSNSYVTVAHGVLSPFEVDESGVVWTATYTPYGDVSALDQVIRLDQGQLQDLSGNLGEGEAHSSVYQLDSAYPTVVITSDTVGVTKEPVRFVLNFSETVTGFDPLSDVVIEGGSLQAWSIETPDNSGRPEGEYSFIVTPSANSVSPIKVRVPEGVAFDEAGNGNARSQVFVQPIDTQKAHIESIEAPEGDYTLGETLRFTAHFNETVTLNLREGVSDHEMPELFLNNGQTARYVSGSGTESWVFEYTVATMYDAQGEVIEIDRSPIRVLSVIENDTYLLDAVGNRTEVVIGVEQGLVEAVSVDTTGPQVQGFSAIDTMTYLEDQVVWIKMTLDEVVTVTRGADGPTLSLSNGGTATYMAGSGSKTLMFRYQVEADDTVTGDLDVTRLVMGSGSIRDLAGNLMAAEISSFASNLSDTQDVAIDTKAPLLMTVSVVEDADTANDVIHDGYYKAGTTVAFDVAFDDAVMVDTTNGMPTLTLSNGERAQYVSGHGTETLRFEYTVEQDDLNRSFLEVVGLSENGGTIRDVSGNDALVEVFNNNLSYSTLVIDTKAPKLSSTADSYTVEAGESDVVTALETVSFSFMAQEAVEFDLSSIDYAALNAQTREDLGLAAEATDEQLAAAIAESVVAAEQALILSQFDVAFSGSRADAGGIALTDLSGNLSVSNFVPVLNADGHMMGFSVDVAMPDRALGEVTVSLAPGAVRDLATNANAVTFSHSQAVDTQTVELTTIPTAGLFIGAESEVRVFDDQGRELAVSVTLNPATGQATIAVVPNALYPNGYRGPVLVEVIDNDPDADYIDEFSGLGVSLSDGSASSVMRAVFNITDPGDVTVTVSPVTELAVRKLLESTAAPSADTPISASQVDQFNGGIAKIFGLNEIVKTKATVVNSALVESSTGVDVDDFNVADGISETEKYGQVLAMLSSRDSLTGSLASTLDELTGQIKAMTSGGTTQLAIKQAGADQLVEALTTSELDAVLDQSGVNRGLLDVAYIEEAAASGFGLNLAEAESATIPIKGAQLGDTVVVQWGTIQNADLLAPGESVGDANTFTVVITEANIDADGNVRVPVPLDVIQKQGDATEVAVRNAIIPAGATNEDGTPKTEVTEDDYQAPVLLTVDIIPPQTTVAAPDAAAPFVTRGDVEGIRSGDDLNILLNNSADEHFKYALSTDFLGEYETLYAAKLAEALAEAVDPSNPTVAERSAAEAAAEAHALANLSSVPAGLQVTNIAQDAASGTWTFDWSLDLTQAISVAEAAAQAAAEAAGESYTPVATFTANDARSVFQVQASTADLVGNADADDARNEVIIGSVDDIVDSPEEQKVMDQALNRLSARYGDDAVDTRAEIQTIANAIDGIASITGSDAATVASEMTRASQTLVLGSGGSAGSPGAVAQGVHNLVIGEQTYTLDLSDSSSPTVADVISAIQGETGYADLPYTVSADASGNGVAVHWKAFGPQPAAVADVAVTTTETATQLSATITHPGGLASFAKQAIALDGTTDADGVFTPAVGDVDLAFDGVTVSASVAEGDTLADVLAALQGESDYGSLPFALAINESGDGFTATWKQTQNTAVTEQITVDRAFEVTTTTETTATIVEAGAAGLTTAELTALDIQNVDDSELAAIARAIASDRASVSAPVVSFADVTMAAGETTTATLTFATRVGQVPDDALALIGGSFSSEGAEGDPIWTSTDGLTWTATFTATSAIPNTGLTYTEQTDDDGNVILDDNGDPILEAVVADDTTTPVTYDTPVSALSQVAITEALVNRVTDAAATVAAFADTQGASASPAPSVQDFADMAVENVRNDNVDAINDALSLVRDRFEGEGDLFTQIQTVTDSYNAVFNTVYASGDQPTAQNLVEDLNNLGVSNLSSDAARAEDQTTLLQGALQAMAAAKADVTNEDGSTTTAAEQQAGMIDSVAKLESFVASVERVLARANGEQAIDGSGTPIVDGNGDPVRVEVSDGDLTALGFGDLLADTDGNSRLSSLQKVIIDQSVGNGSAAIVDYANLKAVLETASDAFDDIVGLTASAQDTGYADEAAKTAAIQAAVDQLTPDSFKAMGVDGVSDVVIAGIANKAAMAAIVQDALINTPDSIDSLEAIQAIVDNYTQVLSVASGDVTGAEAVITNAQFANLGVTLSSDDAQEPSALAELLSGIIANKASPANGNATDNVDSISELQALADAAKKVFDSAALDADPAAGNVGVLATQTDLNTLGFDTVDADNLDAIQRVLVRNAADRDAVKDYTDLKSLIDAAVDAHTALTDLVATAQGGSTPDLTGLDEADFAAMGLDDVDSSNVAAALDALSNTPNSIATAAQLQAVVDSTNVILDTASNDAGTIDKSDLTNIGITLSSGALTDNDASLTSGVIASLSSDKVDTVSEVQAIVTAIDAVFANAARTTDDDTTNTVTVTKAQLLTLGFDGSAEALEVTDHNLDAIQRVLTDQANEDAVASYAQLRTKINDAITAHEAVLDAASTNDSFGITEGSYAKMGIDGVDAGNVQSINDALLNTTNTLTTAASVQEMVDSYNHILDLRDVGASSTIVLDAADFTDLGVTLKAAGAEQTQQLAYLQEIVKDGVGNGSIATVADLQKLANATSDLIDMIQEASPDSDGVTGLTPEQFALLGIDDGNDPAGAITAAQADMLNKRLALTADDLSDVTNLATDLKGLWDAATASLAKIKAYAESDATADYDTSGSFDSGDVPTVDDFKNIGVVDYDNGSDRTTIDATNLDAINELFAATTVGADTIDNDMPATTAAEDQAVIDQGATRLQAILKIANYAQNNGVNTTTYPAPDAADFAAAGVTGVADDNNVATLLTRLRGTTSATNFAKADTAAELQAFVKKVAIDKIAKWADTDGDTVADGTGVNAVAPILQDYVNAGLVDPNDNALTAAMVPALNELFASSAVTADAADTDALQQGIIDGAATQLAAMAKIASYAGANGAIDLDNDAGTGDANGYDQLTVADFDAIGVFGVGDGTGVSTGSGVDTSNTTFNNLTAVLNKLAEAGITYVNADTAAEVQALVGQVAVEKIAYYADEDGQLPLATQTIAVAVDAKTGGGNAFYLDLDGDPATTAEEAPALDLAPGTYTFTQSDASNVGHPLTFFLNNDRSGDVATQGITVTSTGVAGSNGVTTLVIPEGFDGTLYYECVNHNGMGNSVDVAVPYFEPELQDYTNAGLQDLNDAAISENQLPFVNAIFAQANIGDVTEDAGNGIFDADDFVSQQAALDYYGTQLLSLEKFVDYMLTENSVTKSNFTLADFSNAGLLRVNDNATMSDILDLLPTYENKDTLARTDLGSVNAIQAFVSRAIIASYEVDPANHQAPVGADYVAAGITGADDDNAAAMNYQVATNAGYSDSIYDLDLLVTPANAAIAKLATDNLDHIDPITTDSSVTVAGLTAYTFTAADFGDYKDPSDDALGSVKIATVPASGRLLLADATSLSVTPTTSGADAVGGTAAISEVQTIDASSLTAHAVYELQIGADTVSVTVDENPTAAELTALLENALNKAGIAVTAANPSSSDNVTLTWDTAGSVSDAVTFAKQAVVVQANDAIAAADITAGYLTYEPTDTTTPAGIAFSVVDSASNESAAQTLSIDRTDFSTATAIANSGLVQADEGVWSNVYIGDALTGYDALSSVRVVISATQGDVRFSSISGTGVTEITTGFDRATNGGDEIAIEGTQAQVNTALKLLQTKITAGQEKVDISIDVQPGGAVYNPENGHFYKVYSEGAKTWSAAKSAAESKTFEGMQGYLVTITRAEENAFISSKVAADSWLGGSDAAEDGVWRWVTGPEGEKNSGAGTIFYLDPDTETVPSGGQPGYDNFNSGEPNGHNGGESYSQMYASSGRWNDLSGSATQTAYVVEFGGLSTDVSTIKSGVRTLTVYATEALANVDMTLTDFEQAGVTGVTANNIAAINQVLSTKASSDTNSNPKLQTVVNDTVAALAKVEDYNNGANSVTTLSETDYAAAGVVGVTSANLSAINSDVLAKSPGGADTYAKIQAIVSQNVIEAYAESTDGSGLTAPTVADYHALGIFAVDSRNLTFINKFVLDATTGLAEDTSEIALLVQEALELRPRIEAVAKIKAYAESDGATSTPTLDDYVDAQISGVNEYNVGMANGLFAETTIGADGGDTLPAATQAQQQAVIDASSARLAAYAKIVSYAENDAGPVPADTDYAAIGITGLPADYVAKINSELLTAPIDRTAVDEFAELETLISRIKITEYANNNGMTVADVNVAMTGDYVPTKEDYANVGVTEIWDGTALVAIDDTNVEQVNDLMAMRYVGDPDTNGDATVDGSDNGRINVINNATDAATNETNLAYAGTVNTVAEIQDAVAKAMGDDSGTIGTRVEALNKINAYIADQNNSAPTATDYNNAGVLDINDSTAAVNAALATAINNKLIDATAPAPATVNTATELQPYVDSAYEVVNKIQSLAAGTYTTTAETDYVDLVYSFANGDFSEGLAAGEGRIDITNENTVQREGTFAGWNYTLDQLIPGTDTIAGLPILSVHDTDVNGNILSGAGIVVDGTNRSTGGDQSLFLDTYSAGTAASLFTNVHTGSNYSVSLDGDEHLSIAVVNDALQLQLNLDHVDGTSSNGFPQGNSGVYRGPAIYSQETYLLNPGDKISIDWRALTGGAYGNDAPAVIGYLAKVGATSADEHILLINHTDSGSTDWATQEVTVPSGAAGEYHFVFVGGSAEAGGGTGSRIASTFEIDNIKLETANGLAPVEFKGIDFVGNTVSERAAQQVFDREAKHETGFVTTTASDTNAAILGWKDDGTYDKKPGILQSVRIASGDLDLDNDATVGDEDQSVLPGWFDIEGWDSDAGQWVSIQTFGADGTPATPSSTVAVNGVDYYEFDITNVEQRAFTGFRMKAYQSQGGDGTIKISELDFMALPATFTAVDLTPDELKSVGITGVTASNVSAVNALIKAQLAKTDVDFVSEIQSLVDDVVASDLVVRNWISSTSVTDTDADQEFDAGDVNVPTPQDYFNIGLRYVVNTAGVETMISADNIAAVNELMAEQSLSQTASVTAAGDGSNPAVQTLSAVNVVGGANYELKVGSGIKVSVTLAANATLSDLATALDAALDTNGIAVAVSGSDLTLTWDANGAVSDAAVLDVETHASLESVLATPVNGDRLDAIAKLSSLATATPSTGEIDDAIINGSSAIADGEFIEVKLSTSFGSDVVTETLSATYTSGGGWSNVVSQLSSGLSAHSGFALAINGDGDGVEFTRADGQKFTIETYGVEAGLLATGAYTETISGGITSVTKGSSWTLSTNKAAQDIESGSNNGGTYAFANIIDGAGGDTFEVRDENISVGLPLQLDVEFLDGAKRVTSYDLTFVGDDYPTDWKVYAKDGSGNFTILLDEVTGHASTGSHNFRIDSNVGSYSEIRIEITAANANGVAISEIDFNARPLDQKVSVALAGTDESITVADFAAAGISGVSSSNVVSVVQRLVAKSATDDIDTRIELQSFALPPTQTITIDGISTDSGTAGDFITSDNDGLTVSATLSAVLASDQVVEYSNDGGSTWIDITSSSVSGVDIDHVDSTLTSDATVQIQLRVSNGLAKSQVASKSIVIDTTAQAPVAVAETISIGDTTDVQVSESGTIYLVSDNITVSSLSDITGAGADEVTSAIANGSGTVSVSTSGLASDTYKVYFVDAAGNLSAAATDFVTVQRSVSVSNLSLLDNDSDPANGTSITTQVLKADVSTTLNDTDTVLMTINAGTPIDVTDYVSDGQLVYGDPKTIVTVSSHQAPTGSDFYEYFYWVAEGFSVSNSSSGMKAAKIVYVPTTARGNGEYTDISIGSLLNSELQSSSPTTLSIDASNVLNTDKVLVRIPLLTEGGGGDSGASGWVESDGTSFSITQTFTGTGASNSAAYALSDTNPSLATGESLKVRVTPRDNAANSLGEIVIDLPSDGNVVPGEDFTVPAGMVNVDYDLVVYKEVVANSAGEYSLTLTDTQKGYITSSMPLTALVVDSSDETVALSDSLIGAQYTLQVTGLTGSSVADAIANNSSSLDVQFQLVGGSSDAISEPLFLINGDTQDYYSITKNPLMLVDGDEIVLTVKDSSDVDVTGIPTTDSNKLTADIKSTITFESIENDIDFITNDGDGTVSLVVTMNQPIPTGQALEVSLDPEAGTPTWSATTPALVSGTRATYTVPVVLNSGAINSDMTDVIRLRLMDGATEVAISLTQSITADVTDPSSPTHSVSAAVTDGTAVTISGEANAQIYLVLNTESAVLTALGNNDISSLLALSAEKWARADVGASPGGVGVATDGLTNGTYNVYQLDEAGNISSSGTAITINAGTNITAASDVSFLGLDLGDGTSGPPDDDVSDSGDITFTDGSLAGSATSDDSSLQVLLDLEDVAAGDVVELYADGVLIFSDELSAGDITSGKLLTGNLNLQIADSVTSGGTNYAAGDDKVLLEVKVNHLDKEVQGSGDVTWEYQW